MVIHIILILSKPVLALSQLCPMPSQEVTSINFARLGFDSAEIQTIRPSIREARALTYSAAINGTRYGGRIGRAQASHAEGLQFESRSNQTDDFLNVHLSVSNLALSINYQERARMVRSIPR